MPARFLRMSAGPLIILAILAATAGVATSAAAPTTTVDRYTAPLGGTVRRDAAHGVLANDTSADRSTLRAVLSVPPRHGTVVLAADGSFVYRPVTGYEGRDSFGYVAVDRFGRSALTAAKFAVNQRPTAAPDAFTVAPGATLTRYAPGVLGNDTDLLGTPLNAVLYSAPTHGTLTLYKSGAVIYVPVPGFVGTDRFRYRARDAYGAWSAVTDVTITVAVPNRAPVARADTYRTDEDTPLEVDAVEGVLANDTDGDGDALSAELVGLPTGGVVDLRADGSFVFEPGINADGDVTFTYRVTDGRAFSATVQVLIDVIAGNDPPEVNGDQYSIAAGSRLEVPAPGVLGNDSDPVEFDGLRAELRTQPATGVVTMNPDGSFTFDADPGGARFDSFEYAACDSGSCSQTTVELDITEAGP